MRQASSTGHTFPIFSSGIDWLSAFCRNGESSLAAEHHMDQLVQKEKEAGRHIEPASCLGFIGLRATSFFFGRRKDGCLVQLSGHHAPHGALDVIRFASNVSRIDFQVTVYTNGEAVNLARMHFNQLESNRYAPGRQFGYSLITQRPTGDTLNVNRRISDAFGRCYDKSAESMLGPARTVWRYEVELKRRAALNAALAATESECVGSFATGIVREFYRSKGIEPAFEMSPDDLAGHRAISRPTTDYMAWFRKSVSITVARSVKEHGLATTLDALGLGPLVQERC